MTEANGHFKSDITQIKNDVRELKDDLALTISNLSGAINRQSEVISKQTGAIASQTAMTSTLITRLEVFSNSLLNSIPIKAVMWMFVILGLTITLVIAGVEGVRAIAPNLAGLL